jgi:hypothetical protein
LTGYRALTWNRMETLSPGFMFSDVEDDFAPGDVVTFYPLVASNRLGDGGGHRGAAGQHRYIGRGTGRRLERNSANRVTRVKRMPFGLMAASPLDIGSRTIATLWTLFHGDARRQKIGAPHPGGICHQFHLAHLLRHTTYSDIIPCLTSLEVCPKEHGGESKQSDAPVLLRRNR